MYIAYEILKYHIKNTKIFTFIPHSYSHFKHIHCVKLHMKIYIIKIKKKSIKKRKKLRYVAVTQFEPTHARQGNFYFMTMHK